MRKIIAFLLCCAVPSVICEGASFSQTVARRFYGVNSCGPVALAIACRVAGRSVPWIDVCEATHFGGDAISLLDLSQGAGELGFKAEAFQCNARQLERFGGPAIVDFPKGHFSVFLGWSDDGKVRVGDLRTGVVSYPTAEFATRWGGHLLTIQVPDSASRP
ncbi:hypothetical protein GC176_13415 [bacterium]|nr:hypothetical protein [bacterium]